MRFASLGSGSQGNALLVEAGRTRVLIDCGFSLASAVARLARLGVEPESLDAILVTHEHDDHLSGVARLARRLGIPVHLTWGTLRALETGAGADELDLQVLCSHSLLQIGDLAVQPYPVPHDAREPVQFVLGDGDARLGVLTDAGRVTPHMLEVLSACHALVLEFNHDEAMLEAGPYPASLKKRIGGGLGHLSNGHAADLLRRIDGARLRHLVCAHLSKTNNRPELARASAAEALDCDPGWIEVADQDAGFGWRDLG